MSKEWNFKMNNVEVTLYLPEELVIRAKAAGLLTGETVARLLETDLVRQQALEALRTMTQRIMGRRALHD
jgi:ribosomal protein L16/L10AE